MWIVHQGYDLLWVLQGYDLFSFYGEGRATILSCIHPHIYTHTNRHMYTHPTHTCTHMHTHTNTHMHTHIQTYTCTHTYKHKHVHNPSTTVAHSLTPQLLTPTPLCFTTCVLACIHSQLFEICFWEITIYQCSKFS